MNLSAARRESAELAKPIRRTARIMDKIWKLWSMSYGS